MFDVRKFLALGFAVSLAGCSGSDYMFSGSSADAAKPEVQASRPVEAAAVSEGTAAAATAPASNYSGSSTSASFVTQKINMLKSELSQLQSSVKNRSTELRNVKEKMAQDSKKYYEVVAEISSRLQMGTTQGNPILNAKWRDATMMLDTVNQDVTALNNLAAQITADAGMTTYILDSVRASYNISGAVDEDHNQLKILEDETIQTAVQNERLLSDLNSDIARQQQYIVNEKKNLANLAVAIRDGQLYSNNHGIPATQSMKYRTSITEDVAPRTAEVAAKEQRRALVEVRFAKDSVAYEQPLYLAMQKAIEQKPDVGFEVVGVAAKMEDAKKYADNVVRSMMNMGVPVSRIRTSTSTDAKVRAPEVKVFVR